MIEHKTIEPEVGVMTALEWLDEVRADLDVATPGPWRWRNTEEPLLVGARSRIVMAFSRMGTQRAQPEFRDADGLLTKAGKANLYSYPDARLIASAPDRLDRMERALRAMMEAHAPFRIYELEADGTPKCWNGDESVLATCCESCTPDDTIEAAGDSEWTEDMPYVPWPCPTVATIREALG